MQVAKDVFSKPNNSSECLVRALRQEVCLGFFLIFNVTLTAGFYSEFQVSHWPVITAIISADWSLRTFWYPCFSSRNNQVSIYKGGLIFGPRNYSEQLIFQTIHYPDSNKLSIFRWLSLIYLKLNNKPNKSQDYSFCPD